MLRRQDIGWSILALIVLIGFIRLASIDSPNTGFTGYAVAESSEDNSYFLTEKYLGEEYLLEEYGRSAYEANNRIYEIHNLMISDYTRTAKFWINGKTTPQLKKGDSFDIDGKTKLFVRNIYYSENNGVEKVSFSLV